MKFRISAFKFLPQPFPCWLVTLSANGSTTEYRLQMNLAGQYQLLPDKIPAGQACVVVVDHALPYRRRLQRFPDTNRSRLAMLNTAPDEFPLTPADMLYSLGLAGNDGYLYALPRLQIEVLTERELKPAVVLVSGSSVNIRPCLDAIESYFRLGATADLYQSARLLSPRALLKLKLTATIATLIAGCLFLSSSVGLDSVLEWRHKALVAQGGTLPERYAATEKMAYAQRQASILYAKREARLPAILASLFNTVPPGHSLRNIELKGGILKISGTGIEVKEWLKGQGFPPESITVENMGTFQRFHAERAL